MASRSPGSKPADVPDPLRPIVHLGFVANSVSGREWVGDCIFCGRTNKFYANTETGQWSCKAASCGLEGNAYTFIQEYWAAHYEDRGSFRKEWKALAADRQIPVDVLMRTELAWDGEQWILPVRNRSGSVVNYRTYRIGGKMMSLPGLELALWGHELLQGNASAGNGAGAGAGRVWVCEGEWDAICQRELLRLAGPDCAADVVVSVPGAGVYKDSWTDAFSGREIVLAYDHDEGGRKGTRRVWGKVQALAKSVRWVNWPESIPDKYDIRDFFVAGGELSALLEIVTPFVPGAVTSDGAAAVVRERAEDAWPALSGGGRPTWDETLEPYRRWLCMTPDMEIALKIIYAVVISNQIEGDPLWVHIVGPPGCGKTEMLMSTATCASVIAISTITPNTLVSGFTGQGGADPSLIPKLIGKTVIFKDFTEILKMQRQDKENIYSILRGAFDGEVLKPYGNGITRHYTGVHFSMLSGVTHAIFGEQAAVVGERFLVYHALKGVGFDATDIITAALLNSGNESEMRSDLTSAANTFLGWKIEREDLPIIPPAYITRIVALSQIVAMLRACVERDFSREGRIGYRPQHEAGTRLGKQLKKLLLGLAMLEPKPEVTPECYRTVVRVALDTCIGFNLETLYELGRTDGRTSTELSEACQIPQSTLRDQLEDMCHLGVLRKEKEDNPFGRGAPIVRYWRENIVKKHWDLSGLAEIEPVLELPGQRVKRSRRLRRRHRDSASSLEARLEMELGGGRGND